MNVGTVLQWRIFTKNQGAEVLNLERILEVCEYLPSTCVVHWINVLKKNEALGEKVALTKDVNLAFGPLLLPRICQLVDTWGALCPPLAP